MSTQLHHARPITIYIIGLTAALWIAGPAPAQLTYYVDATCGDDTWSGMIPQCIAPCGPKATIQAGIDAAQGGDSVIVADGVYRGAGNRYIDFKGKQIVVASRGGPAACAIDLDYGRGFLFVSGETEHSVLRGFQIHSGSVVGDELGAALLCRNSSPTIEACWFERNEAMLYGGTLIGGGAVSCDGGAPRFVDCIFADNNCPIPGGGAVGMANAAPVFSRCTFVRNLSFWYDFGGDGGAVRAIDSTVRFEGCAFAHNEMFGSGGAFAGTNTNATFLGCNVSYNGPSPGPYRGSPGGGISSSGQLTVVGCTVLYNRSGNAAGAAIAATGEVNLIDSQFDGNQIHMTTPYPSYFGEGLVLSGSRVRVIGCTIANSASGFAESGGGVYLTADDAWFERTEIRNCSAWFGGGGAYIPAGNATFANCIIRGNRIGVMATGARVRIVNSTIVGNQMSPVIGPGPAGVAATSETTVVNSIVRDNEGQYNIGWGATARYSNVGGGFPGEGNIDADPLFTTGYRIRSDSPCVDAGDNNAIPAELIADRDGNWRRCDHPFVADTGKGSVPIVDIGAYEFTICTGDVDDDGEVGVADLAIILGCFGLCEGDAGWDGRANLVPAASFPPASAECVDLADLARMLADFGSDCHE